MSRGRVIRAILVALAAAVGPPGRCADREAQAAFDEANRLCAAGAGQDDFRRAAMLFESLASRGFASGTLFFDLGNAWQKAGDLGRALAAYRRAERFSPRDPLLENNLKQLLADLGRPPPSRPLIDTIFFWRGGLSFAEQALLVVGLSALAFALALVRLRLTLRGGASPALRRMVAACGTLALLSTTAFVLTVRDVEWTEHGVVVAKQSIARKGNSEGYAPAFTEPLSTGTEFTVMERAGEWTRIALASGLDGWVPAADVVTW